MQKRNPSRRLSSQPTHFPKIPHLLPSPTYMGQKLLKRTARSWARVRAGWNSDDTVVDVDADESAVFRVRMLMLGRGLGAIFNDGTEGAG